jgi:hypothetical protein
LLDQRGRRDKRKPSPADRAKVAVATVVEIIPRIGLDDVFFAKTLCSTSEEGETSEKRRRSFSRVAPIKSIGIPHLTLQAK